MCYHGQLDYKYKKGIEFGEEIGFLKGEEKGRAEGRKEGLEKGLLEGTYKQKLESAQRMKRNGLPVEDIMFYTGLTREEVEAIPV